MWYKIPFINYFCIISLFCRTVQSNKVLNFEVNFQKNSDLNLFYLSVYLAYDPSVSKSIKLNQKQQNFDQKCTNCRIILEGTNVDALLQAKFVTFKAFIKTRLAGRNSILERQFEVRIYEPNFDKIHAINFGNLNHSGHLHKTLIWGPNLEPKKYANFAALFAYQKYEDVNGVQLGCAPIDRDLGPYSSLWMAVDFGIMMIKNEIKKMALSIFQFEYVKNSQLNPDEQCPICLENFENKNASNMVKLHEHEPGSTQHIFHEHCAKRWFENCNFICPICKAQLKTTNIQPIEMQPIFSSNLVLFVDPYPLIQHILMTEQVSQSFAYRQAKCALDSLQKYLQDLNWDLAKLFTFFNNRKMLRLGQNVEYLRLDRKSGKIILMRIMQNELDNLLDRLAQSDTKMSRIYDSAKFVQNRVHYASTNLWREVIGHAVNTVQFVQEREGN